MRMKVTVLTLAAILVVQGVSRADAQPMPQPQTQGGATFISGGVGDDSQQYMQSVKKDYNLRLLFAQAVTGGYFAMLPVQIVDISGAAIVNTVSDGPFFYAKLKPGHYKVTASHNGTPMTKAADVPADGAVDLDFYWP